MDTLRTLALQHPGLMTALQLSSVGMVAERGATYFPPGCACSLQRSHPLRATLCVPFGELASIQLGSRLTLSG